ncbi:MAG: hypothetical protein EZS28_035283 [Streblomastix strix]|uniref:Uncharacterized protein n=1 Tax=Streblomastix strix TaxID=222440 RepID=A0A5J4UGR8_9EUKA|nr:MAG: hypothetical protein EZS28_035283 [Streblomastix strix]
MANFLSSFCATNFITIPHTPISVGKKHFINVIDRSRQFLPTSREYERVIGYGIGFMLAATGRKVNNKLQTEIWLFDLVQMCCIQLIVLEYADIVSGTISPDCSFIIFTTISYLSIPQDSQLTQNIQQQVQNQPTEYYETICINLRVPFDSIQYVISSGKEYQQAQFFPDSSEYEMHFILYTETVNMRYFRMMKTDNYFDKEKENKIKENNKLKDKQRDKEKKKYEKEIKISIKQGNKQTYQLFIPPLPAIIQTDPIWFRVEGNTSRGSHISQFYLSRMRFLMNEDPRLYEDVQLSQFFYPLQPMPLPQIDQIYSNDEDEQEQYDNQIEKQESNNIAIKELKEAQNEQINHIQQQKKKKKKKKRSAFESIFGSEDADEQEKDKEREEIINKDTLITTIQIDYPPNSTSTSTQQSLFDIKPPFSSLKTNNPSSIYSSHFTFLRGCRNPNLILSLNQMKGESFCVVQQHLMRPPYFPDQRMINEAAIGIKREKEKIRKNIEIQLKREKKMKKEIN